MLKRSRSDGENPQNCTEKVLMYWITTMVCSVTQSQTFWSAESTAVNKASGCDRIPVELFKTLKDDAFKVLHSICQQIWKTQQWPQDWKRSILIPIPRKVVLKTVLTIRQLHSSPMRSCLKSCMLGSALCEPRASRCPLWI